MARGKSASDERHEVSAPKVVMYAAGWCPYCARARNLLASKGVGFEEIDVDATGRDCLEAVLQARFAAGSRAAVLHLAFSPPFLETPEVCWSLKKSCGDDVALGESAQVRATMVLPYGIRLELKLPAAPSTERTLPVQLSVVERASAGKL